MPTEYNQALCDLKGNIIDMYDAIFLEFEASEESEWREVNDGFNEIIDLINQYNGENPEYEISRIINFELDNITVFINDNNFDNYTRAFDSLRLIKDFLTEKCEEFTTYYQGLISEADDMLLSGEYESAKLLYQEALDSNPNDVYPANKIEEIDGILSGTVSYDDLIVEADNLFNSNDYVNAKIKYQEALALIPSESYPINKIAEIDAILLNQANYDSLISEADSLFNTEDYENAKIKYQGALALMPNENYPSDRIAEIDILLLSVNKPKEKKYSSPYPRRFSSIFPWSNFFNTN